MAEENHGRRGYLKYVGAISGVALTGCLDGNTDDERGSDEIDDAGDVDDDDDGDADESTADGGGADDSADDDGDADEHEVIAGPDGDWRFEPEDITISVGDTVTWYFDSGGHNVTSHPDAAAECENPEGAEPFTSYEGDDHYAVVDEGEEFEHTFEVPGEYVYVCTPHIPQMTGTILVEE